VDTVRVSIVGVLLFAATLIVSLSVVAWRRRITAGAPAIYFCLCMALLAIYTLSYALELSSNTLDAILFWIKFEYLGIPTMIPMWLLFALSVTGRGNWITPRRIAVLFIIPLVTILANYTNQFHHLYYATTSLDAVGHFPTLVITMGPFYWLHLIYSNICLVIITYLFIHMLVKAAPSFRRQAVIFCVGSLIPWIGYAFYFSGHSPYHLDLIPIAMSITGPLLALGVFQFHVLDIVPIAREIVFEEMIDGVLVLDMKDRIVDYNPAVQSMLPEICRASIGCAVDEVLVKRPELLRQIEQNSLETVQLKVHDGDKEMHTYQSRASWMHSSRGKVVGRTIALHDYTQETSLLNQLKDLARRDGLTGIYNYRHFSELANAELERARRYNKVFSLIILDLDRFKRVNDRYGHAAGDVALKAVVNRCRRKIRKVDIMARFGGEEFVILLPETTPEQAGVLAERLCAAIRTKPIRYDGQAIRVTASFGVTGLVSPRKVSLENLFRAADKALYIAKKGGRDQVSIQTYPARRESA
jgi:diguanylate cyclase (GGDEF)-like protein